MASRRPNLLRSIGLLLIVAAVLVQAVALAGFSATYYRWTPTDGQAGRLIDSMLAWMPLSRIGAIPGAVGLVLMLLARLRRRKTTDAPAGDN